MNSQHAEDGATLRRELFAVHGGKVAEAARRMAVAVARGGKILLAGNGGSAADAQHWAAEFVNRFLMDRPPLPAIALTTDSSVLTSIGNDFGYDLVFTKQVQALGRPGDVFVGISTSGNSANVIGALQAARKQGLFTIGLTGDGGGRMAPPHFPPLPPPPPPRPRSRRPPRWPGPPRAFPGRGGPAWPRCATSSLRWGIRPRRSCRRRTPPSGICSAR